MEEYQQTIVVPDIQPQTRLAQTVAATLSERWDHCVSTLSSA